MSVGLNNLYHTIQPPCWQQAAVCLWVASPPIRHVCESSTCANGVGWGIRLSAGTEASFFYLPAVHVSHPTEQPLYALPSAPRSSVSLDLSSHDAAQKSDGVSGLVDREWQRDMLDPGCKWTVNLLIQSRSLSLFTLKNIGMYKNILIIFLKWSIQYFLIKKMLIDCFYILYSRAFYIWDMVFMV